MVHFPRALEGLSEIEEPVNQQQDSRQITLPQFTSFGQLAG